MEVMKHRASFTPYLGLMASLRDKKGKIIFFLLFYKERVRGQIDYVSFRVPQSRTVADPETNPLTINSDVERACQASI